MKTIQPQGAKVMLIGSRLAWAETLTLFPDLATASICFGRTRLSKTRITLLVRRKDSDLRIWTKEITDLLVARWAEGASGTQIAQEITERLKLSPEGFAGEISRCAVLGKIGRLGLQRQGFYEPRNPEKPWRVDPAKSAAKAKADGEEENAKAIRSLVESHVENGCKYIADDPLAKDAFYCGKPVVRRKNAKGEVLPCSWCEAHYKLVFRSEPKTKGKSEFVIRKPGMKPPVKKPGALAMRTTY